jgi:hypothetical protein
VIQGHETPLFLVDAGVPQGSPLSPILFLLYIAKLYEIGFVDDTNLLTYLESIEENYKKLEQVHGKLL